MRTEWLEPNFFNLILMACHPENALCLRVCLATGLRVSDVLSLPWSVIAGVSGSVSWALTEQKTQKQKTVIISSDLVKLCQRVHRDGDFYVFGHRDNPSRHRTRQAVYYDLRRVADFFGVKHLSPHSARKIYAVQLMHDTGDLNAVKLALNHSDSAVTMIYALSDVLAKNLGSNKELLSMLVA